MLVFWKENLVLLSVPKTGTTALQAALAPRASIVIRDPPILKHAPVYRYRRFLRPMFNKPGKQDPEVMAVVRNPIDWLGSWYRYRHRDDLVGHPNSTRDMSFDDFVLEYTKGQKNTAPFANVGSQARFLTDEDEGLGVDHLFRYEAQEKIIGYLQDRLGMTITLPRANVSPIIDLQLSAPVEAKLRRKCAAEFAVWEQGQA